MIELTFNVRKAQTRVCKITANSLNFFNHELAKLALVFLKSNGGLWQNFSLEIIIMAR